MEEPEASDQIARFSIDCVRQTNADRKLANDVKILETSRETLVFGQVRNKSRAVIDSEVVDLATAKFFAKKRGENAYCRTLHRVRERKHPVGLPQAVQLRGHINARPGRRINAQRHSLAPLPNTSANQPTGRCAMQKTRVHSAHRSRCSPVAENRLSLHPMRFL